MTVAGEDYTLLDNIKGYGYYVGTYLALTALERYWWGEGEFKFYLDGDTDYPTQHSTGSEDYFGGAWAFHHRDESGHASATCFQSLYVGYPWQSKRDHTRDFFRPVMLTRYTVLVTTHYRCTGYIAGIYRIRSLFIRLLK